MSVIVSRVKKNTYYDSVRLMRVATNVQAAAGVLDCAIMVGTERNKEFLKGSRLLTQAVQQATSNDVYFVVEAESPEAAEKALALSESILEGTSESPPRDGLQPTRWNPPWLWSPRISPFSRSPGCT